MKILSATYSPIAQSGPDDVRGHQVPMKVYLPPATTINDRVGVRLDPAAPEPCEIYPDGTDTINGSPGFPNGHLSRGDCFTFVVGEVGDWWIESCYIAPVV